jgi:hypothetical protein
MFDLHLFHFSHYYLQIKKKVLYLFLLLWFTWIRNIISIIITGENLRERDHWGDPDKDERIILRWIFRKWDVGVGTGLSWLRRGKGGGNL